MENYENEIMEIEETETNEYTDIVETDEGSGTVGTGMAIAIGAGLATLVIGGVTLAKKLIAKHKAKKELHKVRDEDFVEVTDEMVEEVTAK